MSAHATGTGWGMEGQVHVDYGQLYVAVKRNRGTPAKHTGCKDHGQLREMVQKDQAASVGTGESKSQALEYRSHIVSMGLGR